MSRRRKFFQILQWAKVKPTSLHTDISEAIANMYLCKTKIYLIALYSYGYTGIISISYQN